MLSAYRIHFRPLSLIALLMGGMVSVAQADDDDHKHKHKHVRAPVNALWKDECGACHVAYPARMLPPESWRGVMAGLDKHFGSDASLDPASAREIGTYLETYARRRRTDTTGTPLLRITETHWFAREHRRVLERTRNNPKVKSPANCEACHTQAENGKFSERYIKVPK